MRTIFQTLLMMAALVCATTVRGADARFTANKADFEAVGFVEGNPFTICDDEGTANGVKFWSSDGADADATFGVITNSGRFGTYTPAANAAEGSPAQGTQSLYLIADAPLIRAVQQKENLPLPTAIGDGIFFDSLLQFTATDVAPEPYAGDKILVWLKETYATDGASSYKLMVTAATLNQEGDPTRVDYEIDNMTVTPGTWYRLTVSAKTRSYDGANFPYFEVYIDGTLAQAADNTTPFYSLQRFDATQGQSLEGVVLEGIAVIDELGFSATNPFPETEVETTDVTLNISDAANNLKRLEYSLDGVIYSVVPNTNIIPNVPIDATLSFKAILEQDAAWSVGENTEEVVDGGYVWTWADVAVAETISFTITTQSATTTTYNIKPQLTGSATLSYSYTGLAETDWTPGEAIQNIPSVAGGTLTFKLTVSTQAAVVFMFDNTTVTPTSKTEGADGDTYIFEIDQEQGASAQSVDIKLEITVTEYVPPTFVVGVETSADNSVSFTYFADGVEKTLDSQNQVALSVGTSAFTIKARLPAGKQINVENATLVRVADECTDTVNVYTATLDVSQVKASAMVEIFVGVKDETLTPEPEPEPTFTVKPTVTEGYEQNFRYADADHLATTNLVVGTQSVVIQGSVPADYTVDVQATNATVEKSYPSATGETDDYTITIHTATATENTEITVTIIVTEYVPPVEEEPGIAGDGATAQANVDAATSQTGIILKNTDTTKCTLTQDTDTFVWTLDYGAGTVTIPAYYTVTARADGTGYDLALNEKALPEIGAATVGETAKPAIEVATDGFRVTITSSESKLYYALKYAETLADLQVGGTLGDRVPGDANGAALQVPAPLGANGKGFYKLVVRDYQ